MKNILFLFLLLIALKINAQKSVVFKMNYLPHHNYDAVLNMKINGNVTLSGNEEIAEKLKSQGITQPITVNLEMNITGSTKTGDRGADDSFPLSLNYQLGKINVILNGKSIPIPDMANPGITVYAHVGKDEKIKADSLGTNKLKDTSEARINQLINSIQNKIKFPDHPLHIGDTFVQDVPLNIPMAENSSETLKTTYKLVSISDGKAYFDVSQNIEVQLNIKQVSLTISGTGTGKLIYSIKDSFPIYNTTILNLKVDGKVNTLTINGLIAMNAEYKYTIN